MEFEYAFRALGVAALGMFVWATQRHLASNSQNTIQLAILGEQIKNLTDQISKLHDRLVKVDKLEVDMRVAHTRIKALQADANKN